MPVSKKPTTKNYKTFGEIINDLSLMLTPPEDLTVAQAAEKYRYVNNPGSYVGPWRNSKAHYLVEPMNVFVSAIYAGEVFVGPAQSGKTDGLAINTLAYSVKVDPMDMIIYCPGMTEARDFGMRRVDRLHRHSPAIGEMLLPTADADNRFDKQYSTGMLFTISWPTPSTLAGKPVPRIVITDRDRMDDNIGGDGEVFDLAQKRNTTFGSYGMTLAESSPSREVGDLRWIPATPHQAPPCEGILKLYNRGDRRRWYWPCPHCEEYFEGLFKHLEWDNKLESPMAKAESVIMRCPVNGCEIHPDERDGMQFWGVWLKDGQKIDKWCRITGEGIRTSIASFWLRGVAASFIKWSTLVENYLIATDEYERTGSEEKLRQFYNNDLAEPYYPKRQTEVRLPEVLKSRAEQWTEGHVPDGVRFLIATIDVQKHSFVVHVFGVMPGDVRFDLVCIDRFLIQKSNRVDSDGDRLWLQPHAYLEDWDLIETEVMNKEYPLDDGSGRMMAIKFTACDSGGFAEGKERVTMKAYDFYRKLRNESKGGNFILLKGETLPNRPRVRLEYPDSQRKDNKSAARGDIPVLFLNSNMLKDDLDGRLDCLEFGKGMFRFGKNLEDNFFKELCVEVRVPDKGWVNEHNYRQEAWDCAYYAIGVCISRFINVEGINWSNAPAWAQPWDTNILIRKPDQAPISEKALKSTYDFAAMAGKLA